MGESVTALTAEEIGARISGLDLSEEGDKYRFFKPTSEAVDKWVQYAKGSHDCFYLGLQDIDTKMRGVWPSDILVVTGRAHSGKSAVLLSSIARNLQENPDFYSVIYTPDEPEVLVVAKLYALLYKRNLAEVEEALRTEDRDVLSEIREARDGFLDRVKIFPTGLSFDDMSEAMRECEDYWQHKPGFVMVDFLEQLPKASGYEGVSNVLKGLKEWAETEDYFMDPDCGFVREYYESDVPEDDRWLE